MDDRRLSRHAVALNMSAASSSSSLSCANKMEDGRLLNKTTSSSNLSLPLPQPAASSTPRGKSWRVPQTEKKKKKKSLCKKTEISVEERDGLEGSIVRRTLRDYQGDSDSGDEMEVDEDSDNAASGVVAESDSGSEEPQSIGLREEEIVAAAERLLDKEDKDSEDNSVQMIYDQVACPRLQGKAIVIVASKMRGREDPFVILPLDNLPAEEQPFRPGEDPRIVRLDLQPGGESDCCLVTRLPVGLSEARMEGIASIALLCYWRLIRENKSETNREIMKMVSASVPGRAELLYGFLPNAMQSPPQFLPNGEISEMEKDAIRSVEKALETAAKSAMAAMPRQIGADRNACGMDEVWSFFKCTNCQAVALC